MWETLTVKSPVLDWELQKGDLIERTCGDCATSHKKIVYTRFTDPGTIDFKNLFLYQVKLPYA